MVEREFLTNVVLSPGKPARHRREPDLHLKPYCLALEDVRTIKPRTGPLHGEQAISDLVSRGQVLGTRTAPAVRVQNKATHLGLSALHSTRPAGRVVSSLIGRSSGPTPTECSCVGINNSPVIRHSGPEYCGQDEKRPTKKIDGIVMAILSLAAGDVHPLAGLAVDAIGVAEAAKEKGDAANSGSRVRHFEYRKYSQVVRVPSDALGLRNSGVLRVEPHSCQINESIVGKKSGTRGGEKRPDTVYDKVAMIVAKTLIWTVFPPAVMLIDVAQLMKALTGEQDQSCKIPVDR